MVIILGGLSEQPNTVQYNTAAYMFPLIRCKYSYKDAQS